MECCHICVSVRISRIDVDLLKKKARQNIIIFHQEQQRNSSSTLLLCGSVGGGERLHYRRQPVTTPVVPVSHRKFGSRNTSFDVGNWNCVECGTTLSPWLCLFCGLIHCGRYVNQDGLKHYNFSPEHCLCMDCNSYAVFCYSCDDFVNCDTHDNKLEAVRESLRVYNNSRESDHSYFAPNFLPLNNKNSTCNTVNFRPKRSLPSCPNLNELSGGSYYKESSTDSISSNGGSCKRLKTVKSESQLALNPPAVRFRGLRNLGNTCFMNAVLQALKNIDEFSDFFVKMSEITAFNGNGSETPRLSVRTRRNGADEVFLTEELRKTIQALKENGSTAISPDALFSVVWKLVPRFRGFQQQDAHEFLRCVLDRLHCELKSLNASKIKEVTNNNGVGKFSPGGSHFRADNPVSWIFEGVLQSEVTCLICGSSSRKLDPFLDLSLDIPVDKASKKAGRLLSLFDCLDSFFDKEKLDFNDKYMCSCCRKKQPSTKQFFVRRLPNVLCLHLKRFRWSHHRTKLDGYIQFPLRGLDGRPFLLRNVPKTRGLNPVCSEFDLAAIIVHHGSGASTGHYTAYALRDDSWYHFNDSTVRACSEETVLQQKAYMLFYIRKHFSSTSSGGNGDKETIDTQ